MSGVGLVSHLGGSSWTPTPAVVSVIVPSREGTIAPASGPGQCEERVFRLDRTLLTHNISRTQNAAHAGNPWLIRSSLVIRAKAPRLPGELQVLEGVAEERGPEALEKVGQHQTVTYSHCLCRNCAL